MPPWRWQAVSPRPRRVALHEASLSVTRVSGDALAPERPPRPSPPRTPRPRHTLAEQSAACPPSPDADVRRRRRDRKRANLEWPGSMRRRCMCRPSAAPLPSRSSPMAGGGSWWTTPMPPPKTLGINDGRFDIRGCDPQAPRAVDASGVHRPLLGDAHTQSVSTRCGGLA